MPNPSKILLLYTGGTIGMVRDEKTNLLKPFDFQQLLKQIPELAQLDCQITTDTLDNPIDSSNIKPEHWIRLAKRIAEDYENFDGFVILHGSDTMAYTASALSFLLENLGKPVILTGSQLPIGIARSDARENMLTTMEIAMACDEKGRAKVPEVAIYFEYSLYRGNRTHKISTEDFEAFVSMNYPPLAEAGVHIKFDESALKKHPENDFHHFKKMSDEVGVLTLFPGISEAFVKAVLSNSEMKVLLLRTFGAGNGPMDPWLIRALHHSIQDELHIVNVSQCHGGRVEQGKYEASHAFLAIDVISAGDMTFESALTKSMFLLGNGFESENFKQKFEENLRGELSKK